MVKDFSLIHPELQEDEILFSNMKKEQFESMKWKSKRMGEIAYDGEGNELGIENWFPVFISKKELRKSNKTIKVARDVFWGR